MDCAYCHNTRFGLASYQLWTAKGYVYFDRKRCRDEYLKAIKEERNAFIKSAYRQETIGKETPQHHSGVNGAAVLVRQYPTTTSLFQAARNDKND